MSFLNLPDLELMALNVYMEARSEKTDGQAAVARVVLNRTKLHYMSDGTIQSTILWNDQFSWTQFGYSNGRYTKIYLSPQAQEGNVLRSYQVAQKNIAWLGCKSVAQAVMDGSYHSVVYDRLTDDVVLYYAPAMVHAPAWAGTDNLVAVIGRQWFFKDPGQQQA